MEELNACTECGFTTKSIEEFTSHIEEHEEEYNRSSSNADLSHSLSVEWMDGHSPTPSPPNYESDEKAALKASSPTSTSPTGSNGSSKESETSGTPPREVSVILENALYGDPSSLLEMAQGGKAKPMHVCPHCNFTTFMSQHMKSHLEAHERHQGQMYKCDICQMQFSQKANMHRHRMRHSGVKPYECRYCKKRFFRKDQMQEHSMTHIKTGADFDCPVAFCSHQFSQHSALRQHLDDSHTISPSSPASCKRCSLLFANSRRLLLHYQTRHDENDRGATLSPPLMKKDDMDMSPVAKKPKCPSSPTVSATVLINETPIRNIGKKSNDHHSRKSSADKQAAPNYGMSNEDLLMLCLTNGAMNQQMMAKQYNVSMENALLGWNGGMPSMVPIVPPVEPSIPSPSAESSAFTSASEKCDNEKEQKDCQHCGVSFCDSTMHLLHKGLHTEGDPFRCNLCGVQCGEKYMFTTHIIFANHSS